MPLLKRAVEPSALCQQPIPRFITNELQCMTNNALSGAILQLSSLSVHAEDMFGELFNEANSFYSRASSLQGRIDKLTDKVTRLDSSVEEVSLHDINMRKAFRSAVKADQQVVSRESLLETLRSLYNTADKPPPLQILNKFRDDGRDALKIYTDPDYFFNLWRDAMQKELRDAREKRRELKRKERKAHPPGYRQERAVKEAVPTSRMKAQRLQRGAEFVDAPAVSRKRSPEKMKRQRTTSSHSSHSTTTPTYPTTPPPPIPRYNDVASREAASTYSPSIHTPPTPSYSNPVYHHDPPPQYNDLPEPPPPPPIHRSPVPPSYMPTVAPPLPPSPPLPQNDVDHVVLSSSLSPGSPVMHFPNALPPAPAPPPMNIPPPPPVQPEPVEEEDGSPEHQSEMAKMLASVRLNKVEESDKPARVLDSRSELLQAIRVGHTLKKVEREEKSSARVFSGNDVAAILARSVVMMLSDSESDAYTSDDDSEWDV